MSEAVIVDAIRTPIGRAFKGSLTDVRADELAALPLKTLVARNPKVDFAETGDVMMGSASAANEQGFNVGRTATLLSGIDYHVPACTVNRFCASSLQTIRMAFHAITADEGDQYIAAGVESVSRYGGGPSEDARNPKLDGSEGSLFDVYIPMGMTAENVADKYGVSREAQDEWAALSQSRAVEARDNGHFDREIVEVTKDDGTIVSQDDGPRPGTTTEVLAGLKPVFKEGGSVTAGNACPLNDGAAAVLVMSAEKAEKLGVEPRARIIALDGRGDPAGVHGRRADSGDQGAARARRARRSRTSTSSRSTRRSRRRSCRARTSSGSRRSSSTRSAARSRSATRSA